MKESEAIASPVTLMYKPSWIELAWSMLIVLGVTLFSFTFAPEPASGSRGIFSSYLWNCCRGWLQSCAGDVSLRLLSRGLGCVLAGLSAAVSFVVIRHLLFWRMRTLRMIEYYRIRIRLFYWTLCVVLSISCSRFYVDLFVPVTPRAVLLAMSCLAIWLVITFLRLKRPIFLIVEYALLGALSAVSATGFAMLLISTLILFIAKFHIDSTSVAKWMSGFGHGRGYGYGGSYGSYGGYGGYGGYGSSGSAYGGYGYADEPEDSKSGKIDRAEQRALLAERLRLSLILFYCLGFIAMVVLLFVCGMANGVGGKELVLEWISHLWQEVKCTLASGDLLVVVCVVMISVVFARYRFYRMLDDEYYILTKDVIRLASAALVGIAVVLGIGLNFVLRGDVSMQGLVFVPFSLQIVSGLVMLMSIIVFLVNMKCRKCKVGDEESEGDNAVRQFNWMAIPFLLFLDVCPAILVAFSTFDIWRKFL